MASRELFSTGAPWESVVGYSRAVKVGNHIAISGTVAIVDGEVAAKGNAYMQTRTVLSIIEKALNNAGASLGNVIRTRMFVTDISRWEEIGRAHGEFFKDIRPATTMVEVKALIDPDLLVEIECDAIVD